MKRKLKLFQLGRQDRNLQRSLERLEGVTAQAELLIERGDTVGACAMLESNLQRFAQFADYRAALAAVYGLLGRHADAAEQARVAVDMAPRRADLRFLAAMAYESAGYFSFASRERRAWLRARGQEDARDDVLAFEAIYRARSQGLVGLRVAPNLEAAEKAALLLDEGRWALYHGRFSEALEHSRAAAKVAPGWPAPRNNATVALIYLARYGEARDEALRVLNDLDPQNVHALANLIYVLVVFGKVDEAQAHADRLASVPQVDDPVDVLKQVQGLSWLDRDADIDRVLKDAKRRRVALLPDVYVHWGAAAANAGRRREALAHLREAEKAGVQSLVLKQTLDGLEQKLPGVGILGRYPQTHFSDLLPGNALNEAYKLMQRDEKGGFRDRQAWDRLLGRYPQIPATFERIMIESEDSVENGAMLLARTLPDKAKEILLRFVGSQDGSDEDRMTVIRVMQQTSLIGSREPVEAWMNGMRQTVQPRLYKLSDDWDLGYSPKAIDVYEHASQAQAEGKTEAAVQLYREALSLEPRLKEAYNNLGVALLRLGDTAGARECIDKALAIDPLYPFPLVAKALQALNQDGPEAAKAILAPLEDVEHWRPLEMVIYQKGLARIALEERDAKAAKACLALAAQLKPDDPELPALQLSADLLEMESPTGFFATLDENNRRRRLRKPLPSDPSLADCLGVLSVGDMVGIARALTHTVPSPRKRATVLAWMLGMLQAPYVVEAGILPLNTTERDALEAILGGNGVMAWPAFVERFGDESGDRPYLEYWAERMVTVAGRLRARGFVYHGTIDGEPVIVIPRELRSLLQDALRGNSSAGAQQADESQSDAE